MASRLKISSSQTCGVMYIDMVESTKTTCRIADSDKLRTFYETFINTLSDILIVHGARIVKNGGDSIICYFPKTRDSAEKSAFKEMLNCGLMLLRNREILNDMLQSADLPITNYRVSADYGKHEVVKDENLEIIDLFSPTMCVCSKINAIALPNSMVIGSDLYEIVKSFPGFRIYRYGEFMIQEKLRYPVYSVGGYA